MGDAKLSDEEDFGQRVKRLMSWLKDSGSRFPKVELSRYGAEARHLRARAPIKADEETIFVPRKCILEIRHGKETKVGRAVQAEAKGWISGHTYLAIAMLTERDLGAKSFFAPWFDVLPRDYRAQGMPQYWTAEQKREIAHTKTLAKANAVKVAIEAMWDRVSKVRAVRVAGWSLEDFAWARYTVLTRTFGVQIEGREATIMVPLADMANHEFERPSRWKYDNGKGGFVVKVVRDLPAGADLTDTYGSKGNDSFLPFYGFCLESNEYNQARFELPIRQVNGIWVPFLSKLAVSRCAYEEEPPNASFKVIDATTDPEALGTKRGGRELFSYARALCLSGNELVALLNSARANLKRPTAFPISVRNESAALQIIRTAALAALKRFDTTYQEDVAILSDKKKAPPGSWYRNAVLARSGEKHTLLHYVRMADEMCKLLESKSILDFESQPALKVIRAADRTEEWGYHINRYLNKVVVPLIKARSSRADAGAKTQSK